MKTLALALIAAVSAFGAATCTTITDTIQTPFSPTLFSGYIDITGPNMTTAGNVTISKWTKTWTITAGVFSACLEPNDTATPANTSYSVRFRPTSGSGPSGTSPWSETWVVPTSATAIEVNAVRVLIAPTTSTALLLSQLRFTAAGDLVYADANARGVRLAVGSEGECVKIVSGVPSYGACGTGSGGGADFYTASFTSQTSVTVPVTDHNISSANLLVTCYDSASPANEIGAAVSVHPTTYSVGIGFAVAQSGKCIIEGSALSSNFFSQSFTSQTTVSIPAATHGLTVNRISVQCYDSSTPGNQIDGSVTVNSSTYDVSVGFAVAQSGRCVLAGG